MNHALHSGATDVAPPTFTSSNLPWKPGSTPLMLAPMQGLTNRALRALFIDMVRPDVVFTEFMRVQHGAKILASSDLAEIAAEENGVPLVVQLVGHGRDHLTAAARAAQDAGARHINLNVGCPYGRMTKGLTGGGMLRRPEDLEEILPALRETVSGSFSVKIRAGYEDPQQIFRLLPLLESSRVDFLVLHPRTVVQEYRGFADHAVTEEVVRRTALPVVANGDIRTGEQAWRVLQDSAAAGLMLGRGAIADPLLFRRVREREPEPEQGERVSALARYLLALLPRYRSLFCGDMQVLAKMKGVLATSTSADVEKVVKKLQRTKALPDFVRILESIR